jgi:AbrB family looped-hinge helix DNA binding protein
MSGTYSLKVGNKGRVVLPAELRQSRGWSDGTALIVIEGNGRVELTTRDALERRVRAQLAGSNLVEELLAERRAASLIEDGE